MEDSPKREDVALRFNVLSLGESGDFRSDVARSAASVEDVIIAVGICREAEISNDRHKSSVSSQHNVLRLDVPMHDSVVVHFLESNRHSSDELLGLSRSEDCLSFIDAAVQLPVGKKLEYNVDGVVRLEDSLALDDVGAIEGSQHLDLVEKVEAMAGI